MSIESVRNAMQGDPVAHFFTGVPNVKRCMVTVAEQRVSEVYGYLHRYVVEVPCDQYSWNILRREIASASRNAFSTTAYLTPRRKAYFQERAIFAKVSHLAAITRWDDSQIQALLGCKFTDYEQEYYGVAGTLLVTTTMFFALEFLLVVRLAVSTFRYSAMKYDTTTVLSASP